jgi:hypothetical protein
LAQCRVGTFFLRLEKEKQPKRKERKTEDRVVQHVVQHGLLRVPVGFTDGPAHTIASEFFRTVTRKVKPPPETGEQANCSPEQIQFGRVVIPNLTLPGNPGSNLILVTEIEIQFVFPDESKKLPRIQLRGNIFLGRLSVASFAIDHPSWGQTFFVH